MKVLDKRVYTVEELRERLTPIFKQFGLVKAAIFGSYARNEATSKSDIDLLVYLDETFDLNKYLNFEAALKKALMKKIDILEYRCINQFMQEDILGEAVKLYERERQENSSYNLN